MFTLPDLPYAYDALQPVISDRTLQFHHDKHHAAYVKVMNEIIEKLDSSPASLEQVIADSTGPGSRKLYNNAAQAWNHAFFWVSMTPDKAQPTGPLAAAIGKAFGDLTGLKDAFVTEGVGHFGSGWVWLASDRDGGLKVLSTHDAHGAVTEQGLTPLLVCDLWEHAYYLDHQNNRKGFLEAWFDALPNWDLAAHQYEAAQGHGEAWAYPAPEKARAAA
jgi:Fe-Mn family superoxide dismutase